MTTPPDFDRLTAFAEDHIRWAYNNETGVISARSISKKVMVDFSNEELAALRPTLPAVLKTLWQYRTNKMSVDECFRLTISCWRHGTPLDCYGERNMILKWNQIGTSPSDQSAVRIYADCYKIGSIYNGSFAEAGTPVDEIFVLSDAPRKLAGLMPWADFTKQHPDLAKWIRDGEALGMTSDTLLPMFEQRKVEMPVANETAATLPTDLAL